MMMRRRACRRQLEPAYGSYPFAYKANSGFSPGEIYLWDACIQSGHVILLLDEFDRFSTEVVGSDLSRQVDLLADYLPARSRAVVATRGTRFKSIHELHKAFAGRQIERASAVKGGGTYVLDRKWRRYLPRHDIYTLVPFGATELQKLYSDAGFTPPDAPAVPAPATTRHLLDGLEVRDAGFLAAQCDSLASIPACASSFARARHSARTGATAMHLFEHGLIDPLIRYNIERGRALQSFSFKQNDSEEENTAVLDLATRFQVLEFVAWRLLETKRDHFSSTDLDFAYLEVPTTQFEAVVNDLRTQTIFDLCYDSTDLRFRLPAVRAYFTARAIFTKLVRGSSCKEGLKRLGRYDLASSEVGRLILGFLCEMIQSGMVDFPPNTTSVDPYNTLRFDGNNLPTYAKELRRDVGPYSLWTKYLSQNLNVILPAFSESAFAAEWEHSPVNVRVSGCVLVRGDTTLPSFFLAEHEVTNADYRAFIQSGVVPTLVPCTDEIELREGSVRLSATIRFDSTKGDELRHPLSWSVVHEERNGHSPTMKILTNDYHLFGWSEGQFPEQEALSPVTWVSGYVAAVYCNWLTVAALGLDESDTAYVIGLSDENKALVVLRAGKTGFRLPTSREWKHAARADDDGKVVWERYERAGDPTMKWRGELLRAHLTQSRKQALPVTTSLVNGFGLYGMIGNVREWAIPEPHSTKGSYVIDDGVVMGATGALGLRTFEYRFPGTPIAMQNTNMDVGFRWALPIQGKDVETLATAIKQEAAAPRGKRTTESSSRSEDKGTT